MNLLFQFLIRQRIILLFVVLELVNVWSIFKYNDFQHVIYLNTTNQWVAYLISTSREIKTYHQLGQVNTELALENTHLRQEIFKLIALKQPESKVPYFVSAAMLNRYEPIASKVIDQSTQMSHNYLTIDKGTLDGIKPGMAVISSTGVVGKVMSSNPNLSLVVSVLHIENNISAKIKSTGELGYIKWPGIQTEVVEMMDVSKYKKVIKGDTIVTSDYNIVFPPNIPIGIVAKVGLEKDETFHNIKVMLLTNFSTLKYVYVVRNHLLDQQIKLESLKPKSE
jgi:rod shape-determining protein MreC